jgi:PKD repeat protein
VHVNNVAPTVAFATDNDTTVNEGTTHTYSFTVTDPGADTFSVVSFDCGTYGDADSDSLETSASGGSFDCSFPDGPADTNVHVKVKDSDEASDTDSEAIQVVHVNNVAPSVIAAANQSSNEGASASFSLGSFSDPGPDADWSVDVDWGDTSAHTAFTASDVGSLGSQSHAYANGPNDYTVTVTVTDHEASPTDELSGSATFSVHVNNVAPAVTAAAVQSSNEGASASFDLGSFSDPGPDGPWSVDVDWGDSSAHTSFTMASPGTIPAKDHTYADGPNDWLVTVTVSEAGTGTPPSGAASFSVHVNNLAPTGALKNNGPISEGGSATISFASPSDPSAVDTTSLHYAFSCAGESLADATYAGSSTTNMESCSFPDGPSNHIVTGVIIDKDGGRHGDVTTVHVNNLKPTVTAPASQNATEGSSASFSLGSFSDPGPDNPWSGTVDWGDSSSTSIGPYSAVGSLGTASHTYANSGSYTVKVSVTDKDGDTGNATFTVTVANVAPNVTAAANQSGDEGTEKSFDLGSFSDPGAESSWSVDVNWGDSTAHTTFTKSSAGSLGSKPHTYVDNGTYTVTVKVSDDAGNGSATFTITIGNLAPNVLTFTGNDYLYGPLSFLSGSPVTGTFSGTFRDLGIKDNPWIVSYAWDGTNDPATQSVDYNGTTDHNFGPKTHTFTAGCNHSAKATVTDKDGASGFKTTTINVGTGSFMPPMTNQPVTDKLKNGQVLPVKVQLADCAGVSLAGLSPVIELRAGDLTSTPEVGTDTIPVQSVSAADSGNIMRAADGFYIYNLRINVPTLNTPYTIIIYPYGTSNPATLRHVIQATK